MSEIAQAEIIGEERALDSIELQLPLLFICDSHLLSGFVTSVLWSHVL